MFERFRKKPAPSEWEPRLNWRRGLNAQVQYRRELQAQQLKMAQERLFIQGLRIVSISVITLSIISTTYWAHSLHLRRLETAALLERLKKFEGPQPCIDRETRYSWTKQ